jgi:hypothetical protein
MMIMKYSFKSVCIPFFFFFFFLKKSRYVYLEGSRWSGFLFVLFFGVHFLSCHIVIS